VIKGNQSIIVDTTADDESGSRKEAPNGDFDMIPKCMQRNPPPGSTEVLDKIRMIFRLQGNAAPRPKAAGGLASCLQGMMNTEEAEKQQKEKRRRRRRRRRSKGWKRGKKWMI